MFYRENLAFFMKSSVLLNNFTKTSPYRKTTFLLFVTSIYFVKNPSLNPKRAKLDQKSEIGHVRTCQDVSRSTHQGPYGPQPGPGPNPDWAPTRPGPGPNPDWAPELISELFIEGFLFKVRTYRGK